MRERTMIDVRFTAIDGRWALEVWADGHVALRLDIPCETVDVMLYEDETRRHVRMTETLGRWALNALQGPATRRGR